MKLGIMQPYFLPYIGYFQLLAGVDTFVLYDNIKYTKKGWINRNRYLRNAAPATFSLPLKKASDSLTVVERSLSDAFDRDKLLNRIVVAYEKAPHFEAAFAEFERIVKFREENLFRYLLHSLRRVCGYLGIPTELRISSQVPIEHGDLKGQDKVLALCEALGASHYINPIGGTELYSQEAFRERSLELSFLRTGNVRYEQFSHDFVPSLSILDVMMFCDREQIRDLLAIYTLE